MLNSTFHEIVNKKWFIYAFGNDSYKIIENKRVICAGVVWGSVDKFLSFSSKMWDKVGGRPFDKKLHDQSVANYIIYQEKFFDDCLRKSENKNGYILTLGVTKKDNFTIDSKGNILNENGKIAAIVHQYDRKGYLLEKVRNEIFVESKIKGIKKYKSTNNFILSFFLIVFILLIIILKIKYDKYNFKKSF